MNEKDELPALDENGHLLHITDWSPLVAKKLAQRDGIVLDDRHWQLIEFVRQYYDDFGIAPGMRLLVASLRKRLGAGKANSRYLYQLLPDSPARQLACYAGFAKPVSCI